MVSLLSSLSGSLSPHSVGIGHIHALKQKYKDEKLKEVFKKQHYSPTPFGIAAVIAAYNEAEDWVDELNEYLDKIKNDLYFSECVEDYIENKSVEGMMNICKILEK